MSVVFECFLFDEIIVGDVVMMCVCDFVVLIVVVDE